MREISDGHLLWMICFDRHNYTQQWIQQAEEEARRRGLSLQKIDNNSSGQLSLKPIATTFDSKNNDPHPFRDTWWKEILVGISLISCEILLEGYLSWVVSSMLIAILGGLLIHKVSGQNVPKTHQTIAWVTVVTLILIRFFF